MSEVEELVTYVFKWVTVVDTRTCKKCLGLNGKEWHGQDLFESAVWDDIYGEVWGLDEGHSLLHPNCRCQMEVTVEIHLEKINIYRFKVGQAPKPSKLGKLMKVKLMLTDIVAVRQECETLNVTLEEVDRRFNKAYNLAARTLALVKRLSGTDSLSILINQMLDTIQTAQLLMLTLEALAAARMAGGDPLAWFQFAVTGAGLGVSLYSQMEMRSPQY